MDDAKTYRERAKACRRLSRLQPPLQRGRLRDLADGFDRIADARGAPSQRSVLFGLRSLMRGRLVRHKGDVWRALAGVGVAVTLGLAIAE